MGKHSNIILLNEKNIIIDSLRHLDSSSNSIRDILPAHPYELPDNNNNANNNNLDNAATSVGNSFLSKYEMYIGLGTFGVGLLSLLIAILTKPKGSQIM